MSRLGQTPSSTVGPFFSMKLAETAEMAPTECSGQHIRIKGVVLDGDGDVVEDAMIEIWQANAAGRYRHPGDPRHSLPLDPAFTGYGRAHTEFATGRYSFTTIKPGRVPATGGGDQAPHLNLIVTARGMLKHLFTRLYFADEQNANVADPVLLGVPGSRGKTLIAEKLGEGDPATYRFDVRLAGADETVFFDV